MRPTYTIYKDELCKLAASSEEVHAVADRKGVVWDAGKPGAEGFMRLCQAMTGKRHLDEMTDAQRDLVIMALEMEKRAAARTAVIITGNPKYIEGNERAQSFYRRIQKHLERKGYEVTTDPGAPYTSPPKADLWVAHSRGADRLRWAPEGTRVLGLNVIPFEDGESGRPFEHVNHPRDNSNTRDAIGKRIPNRYHYVLTKAMKEKLAEAEGHWRTLNANQQGKDKGGNPIQGRTWVKRKSNLKSWFKPFAHQGDFREAIEENNHGGIIAAHGTGTGKTPSAIYTFEELKGQGKASRALVVVPAGLRENFALKGVEKFTGSKYVIVSNPNKDHIPEDAEYVITSYSALRRHPEAFRTKVRPDVVIADEFQRASNPNSKTHQALKDVRQDPNVNFFMGLSASISQNHPSEMQPLLDIATKGEAPYQSKTDFTKKHVKRKDLPDSIGVYGGKVSQNVIVNQRELAKNVGSAIHYVEDLDGGEKPPKFVEEVAVPMSPDQQRVYQLAMSKIDPKVRLQIERGEPVDQKEALNIFTALLRARQVSNSLHTAIPGMSPREAAEKTPKIQRALNDLEKHLADTKDGKVILYTNFVHGGVDVLEAGLKARGIPYGLFAGQSIISEKKRNQAVRDYQDRKKRVIIITGAGAEGLSLGDTTMVQMIDGHYNPERMKQAMARGVRAKGQSHRKPEDRKVLVKQYKSVMTDNLLKKTWRLLTRQKQPRSVEQAVYDTAARKDRANQQLRAVLLARMEHDKRRRDSFWYRNLGPRTPEMRQAALPEDTLFDDNEGAA